MSTITKPDITPGTWAFDPSHSEIGFSVRHRTIDLTGKPVARLLSPK